MKTVLEVSCETLIEAGPERVWAALEDSTLLPRWASMVKETTGKTERVGSMRTCQVEWDGRRGEVVERCIEASPHQHIMWVMEQGEMKKLFSDIRFGFTLEPRDLNTTLLRLKGIYQPRNVLVRLMYTLMLRRKLHGLFSTLLGNLKNMIETDLVNARAVN